MEVVAESPTIAQLLEEKIRTRQAKVGIVGLGYVGLPLAVEFAKAGFSVTGIDLSDSKVARIHAKDSYVGDVPNAVLAPLVETGKLTATTDFSVVRELDTVNICVPTPLRKTKDPDMSYIVSACERNHKISSCRNAGHIGIDNLSGHHRRTRAAHAGAGRTEGG